jgi:hypothetical protein
MTRIVAGIYPDAQEAGRAADAMRHAGIAVSTATAEQAAGLSDGERERVLIVTDPDDREAEVRSLFMQTGATQLLGHGSEGTGMSTTPNIPREDPVPVQQGERAPTAQAGSPHLPGKRGSDPEMGRDGAPAADAGPRYEMMRDAAANTLDKLELEERLRRGLLGSEPPR